MYKELKARLLAWTKTSSSFGLDSIGKDIAKALEAIEELERQLAESDAEIAKYRDAPVVAWRTWRETKLYGQWEYRHDELELNDDDWQPLIVKPGEQ